MKIVETTKEIIKWFKLIKERRETDLILDNKSYALFSAVAGIVAGVLIGIIIAIVQMALGSNDDTILSIVLSIALVAILGLHYMDDLSVADRQVCQYYEQDCGFSYYIDCSICIIPFRSIWSDLYSRCCNWLLGIENRS